MKSELLNTVTIRLLSAAFSVLVLILTSRWLGPDARGQLAFAILIGTTTSGLLGLSLENSYLSFSSRMHSLDSKHKLKGFYVNQRVLFIVVVLSSYIFSSFYYKGELLIKFFVVLSSGLYFIQKTSIAAFIVDGKLISYNFKLLISKLSFLIGSCLLMVVFEPDMFSLLVVYNISLFIFFLLTFKSSYSPSEFFLTPFKLFSSQLLRESINVHLNSLGTILANQVPILVLGFYASSELVSFYDVSLQLIGIPTLVVTSIVTVFYSRIANAGISSSISYLFKVMVWLYILLIPIVFLAPFVMVDFLSIIFGSAYIPATPLVICFLVIFLLNIPCYFASPCWVMSGKVKYIMKWNIIAGVYNVIGTYFILIYANTEILPLLLMSSSFLLFSINIFFLLKYRRATNTEQLER